MSPPSRRIELWIVRNGFETREEVEEYVRIHGGASLTMDATLNTVFGEKIAREPSFLPIPSTGKTPLEQIREGQPPEEQPIQPISPIQEPIPESLKEATQEPIQTGVKKSLMRRFLDWLGS